MIWKLKWRHCEIWRHNSLDYIASSRWLTPQNRVLTDTDTDGEIKGLKSNNSLISAQEYIVKRSLSLLEYFTGHIARWLETSFPKFNRHEYYTAVSYIIRLGNVRTFKIIWSSKENMVQFFRNQGQRSKNIFHTKFHWILNFN